MTIHFLHAILLISKRKLPKAGKGGYLYQMEAKFFSYKVPGILLQPVNENLKLSSSFNRKELLDQMKELLKDQNFKVDATTLEYKVEGDYIMITGMAVEHTEVKGIGFMSGR